MAATQTWFRQSFTEPTPVQVRGCATIAAGHTLMLVPTGSGKTLAAALWYLDRLVRAPRGELGAQHPDAAMMPMPPASVSESVTRISRLELPIKIFEP